MKRAWLRALALAAVSLLLGWLPAGERGLIRTIAANTSERAERDRRLVRAIDLDGVDTVAGVASGLTIVWRGVWNVPATGVYDLGLSSRGAATWMIDGELVQRSQADAVPADTRAVRLESGYHAIDLVYMPNAGAPSLSVTAARAGQPPTRLDAWALTTRPPGAPRLQAAIRFVRAALGWLALAAVAWAIRVTVAALRQRWPTLAWRRWIGATLAWTTLVVIVAHGALLRLDAITARYGPVSSPRWLAAVQTRTRLPPSSIRSAWIVWQREPLYPHPNEAPKPYRGDPYTYLSAARQMTAFYGAHYREPVFPFATRVMLRLLGDQDVAVSLASAGFSLLAIWLTYLLGAAVWSRPAGLAAALGLSINADVISTATLGWRDDAYVAAVAGCSYLLVRVWRAAQAAPVCRRVGPWQVDGLALECAALGVASGLAILTRVMAVPFLAVGGGVVIVAARRSWRSRLGASALVLGLTLIVAGPYFVNCWRVYGDPLYTFNVHGAVYSAAEGQAWNEGTAAWVRRKMAQRPVETIDTIAQGMTTYPFGNKWTGLGQWGAGLGDGAAAAALAGLVVLAGLATGRLLIVATMASLVPFALTWKVDPHFRFTEHVYPLLLVAAAAAVMAAGGLARSLIVPRPGGAASDAPGVERRRFTSWRLWVALVAAGLASVWLVERVLPAWVFTATVRAGEDATIAAGVRDGAFFDRGWSEVVGGGNVRTRIAVSEGSIVFRLPAVADYPVTLRLDPFPGPMAGEPPEPSAVVVRLNDEPIGVLVLRWTPDRVGAYRLTLPRSAVRAGVNVLRLRFEWAARATGAGVTPGLSAASAFSLWYLRVHPAGS